MEVKYGGPGNGDGREREKTKGFFGIFLWPFFISRSSKVRNEFRLDAVGETGDCIFVSATVFHCLICRCLTSNSSAGSLFLFNVTVKRRFGTARYTTYNYHSA